MPNLRKGVIQKYFKALRLMKEQNKTQQEACQTAQISRMTFNKYRDMFGDEIAPGKFEVPTELKTTQVKTKEVPAKETQSDLERLLAENAALQEQLKLRQELAKYVH